MTKYAAALIQILIALVGALATINGRLTLVDALQLSVLFVNALAVYLVPLFGPNARSGWKTGTAVILAAVAAFIPIWQNHDHQLTGTQIAVVALAALQALGAHIGVQLRNDSAAAASGSPTAAEPTPVEPPTETTVNYAIRNNGGEFLGTPAR